MKAAGFDAVLEGAREGASAFLQGLRDRPAATLPRPPVPLDLPDRGLGAPAALARFRERYEAGLSGSAGPRYLGFVTGGSTPAALAGDWLASAYDQNLSHGGDSLASFVERETLAMLRAMVGLPDAFEGAFVSGATMANAVALATARQWAAERLGVDVAETGLQGLPRIPILGAAPHASLFKAAAILGLGRASVEAVAALPGREAIDPSALEARLRAQQGAPAIVTASAGTVNSGDFDDLERLRELCVRFGAWLHVDGAFGLFAACDPERAHLLRGVEGADSLATDAHKWLNVPYDSGIVFTRHLALQERTFKAQAAYLGAGPDLLHRTPENSRRFRALPVWMTLQAYGREGYRDLVRRNCDHAARLARQLEAGGRFDLLAPVRLNLVCFAPKAGDAEARDALLAGLQADGRAFLTPTTFAGRAGLRAAFVNWSTTDVDVDLAATALHDLLETP